MAPSPESKVDTSDQVDQHQLPLSSDQDQSQPKNASAADHAQHQAVRFASVNQEIEPAQSIQSTGTEGSGHERLSNKVNPEAQAEIRSLTMGYHYTHLQQRRMSNFAFEPVSLPVSRAPSNEPSPALSQEPTRSIGPSPRLTPNETPASLASVTPAGSDADENRRDPSGASGKDLTKVHPDPVQMAPQTSIRKDAPHAIAEAVLDSSLASSAATSRPSSASDHTSTRPTTISQAPSLGDVFQKQPQISRESSPSRKLEGVSGAVTPPLPSQRPLAPHGDKDDPYARNKRPPQSKNLDSIDARFVFGGKDSRRRSAIASGSRSSSSSGALPRSSSGTDLKAQEKRQSTFSLHSLGGRKDPHGHQHDETASATGAKAQHGSMTELKRFLGIGHHKNKRSQSPSSSAKASAHASGSRTPPHQAISNSIPFADDHGLSTKYGKFGKVLGSGAGGSVRLMKRSSDGVTFAVKQFRDRHTYETEREYSKKVTAEFCIGSTLHHGNIIETLDIIHERGHWYEVMEYAPYDLFAIVMTGKMSREEISCSFLQIVSGVAFLHSMGLAHRDLKLDNVVVNEHGIMKVIDFGSASVFRYPFENDIVLATGIVGSDPYLAPEVYDYAKYDPQPTDIWSLAIIFACMSLRRFPWKQPRLTDNSYKLFVSTPNSETPGAEATARKASEGRPKSEIENNKVVEESGPKSTQDGAARIDEEPEGRRHSSHHHHHEDKSVDRERNIASASTQSSNPKQEVIKGPWRLLRLLPRESRKIMGRMLQVDPKNRATLDEMMQDPWVTYAPVCSQVDGGQVVRAPGHEHTLEPSLSAPAAPT